jgi:glycosyltransferase involved in cell wall biosynthesis
VKGARRDGRLDDPELLFLGSMESQDGVDDLPAVLTAVRERHGHAGARMTLVGEGSRREPLREQFARTGLSGAVRFTGQVPHSEVPQLLAQADICVDPAPRTALNDHSTMIKIAEYLAAERPVVAHRLTETAYTAGDAVCFSEEPTADGLAAGISRVATDASLRLALAAAAGRRAPELVWERSERELVAVYDRRLR